MIVHRQIHSVFRFPHVLFNCMQPKPSQNVSVSSLQHPLPINSSHSPTYLSITIYYFCNLHRI